MATRFYLTTTEASVAPAAWHAGWDITNSVTARHLASLAPTGSAFATYSLSEDSASNAIDGGLCRWVSNPLRAQTVTGNFVAYALAHETSTSANMRSQIYMRVFNGDCTVERGVLYDGDNTTTVTNEWFTSALTNRKFPRLSLTGTVTSVAVQQGDRLVVELGYRALNTSATVYTGSMYVGDAGGSDLSENEASTDQTANPWLEFVHTFYQPVTILAPPADATADAPAPYNPRVTAPPVNATADAPAPKVATFRLSPPANATADAPASTIFYSPVNDSFARAIVLAGVSGSGSQFLLNATRETGEPVSTHGIGGTVWFRYIPTDPGDLTFTHTSPSGYAVAADVFDGTVLTELEFVVAGNGLTTGVPVTVSTAVASGITYYIRLNQEANSSTQPRVPYSFTYVIRIPELKLTLRESELEQTPATLIASVTNGTPDAVAVFTIAGVGGVTWIDVLDVTGVLTDVAVPIPALDAGTYTLEILETGGRTGTVTFTIATDPLERPTDLPADTAPVLIPRGGVQRWVVQDPSPGGTSYTFPLNPREMGSPHAARSIVVEATVAVDGQALSFEGAPRPHQWEFKGWLDSEAHHNVLAAFVASNKRYFLIDHRNRAWVVIFEHFEAQPQITASHPFAHEYTMRCLILEGPEQL